ncbi:MAG: FtsX-like permease family protein, partial [Anaerolineaceae bacterium]|nr:FtsX-like permease family protein [Anaerolineaceae bacterium]
GKHPVMTIANALMAMVGLLGALTVFLSAFLVVNTINAQISQHIRQIGVMKAIGGRTEQITGMYVVLVLGFGLLALLIAMPLSALVSTGMINALGQLMNFNTGGFRIPFLSLILQLFVALVVPLIGALLPILRGARMTVREAISNYGLGADHFGKSRIDRLVEKVQLLPRPLLISLRNTFRRKGRLLLTLSTLTLGGAIFIAVFNLRASFQVTIQETFGYFLSDVNLSLNRYERNDHVQSILQQIPGIKETEAWGTITGQLLSDDQQTGTELLIWGPPAGSQMIQPIMKAGRWLTAEDENAMVIGNHVLAQRPDLQVGDVVTVRIDHKDYPWTIVGIYQMAGNVSPPFVYVNNEYLNNLLNIRGRAGNYRIAIIPADDASEYRIAEEVKTAMENNGIPVVSVTTGAESRQQTSSQIDILVYTLMFMAVLIALVGGLGLMGTMSMNVLERTREIGVMRSIGASNLTILLIVVVEGLTIGLISWGVGALLAIPISRVLSDVVGVAFLTTPLTYVFSYGGFVLWFIVVTVLSSLASILPAMNAVRLTVRDVLAYE